MASRARSVRVTTSSQRPPSAMTSHAVQVGVGPIPSSITIDWDDPFWSKVAPEQLSGCWLWMSRVDDRGYGVWRRTVNGRLVETQANRFALMQFVEMPAHLYACHKCDVPACVNPDHLYAGTAADNIRDCVVRGRSRNGSNGFCDRGHDLSAPGVRSERTGRCKPCAVRLSRESRERRGKPA